MSLGEPPAARWSLYSGADQPARRNFHLAMAESVSVAEAGLGPFATLIDFRRPDCQSARTILVVPPLSGHFAILMRDLIIDLLPHFRVLVIDWTNVRHVPSDSGRFSLDSNLALVMAAMKQAGRLDAVIGLCQGGVSAFAATALLAQDGDQCLPSALILAGAPIDPLANSTRVVGLLRSQSLGWFEDNLISMTGQSYAGHGRPVYAAERQLAGLRAYLARNFAEAGEMWFKVLADDGHDASRFPFLDLFTSIMDLDAAYFLDNIRHVYHESSLTRGQLTCDGAVVRPERIRRTALLTIEGGWDDIAAPGQTSAAHALCRSLDENQRGALVVPCCGHFSLFHGNTWRHSVLPAVTAFCDRHCE